MTATVARLEAPATTDESYVGALDGLRAIAVAAVIVYHFAPTVLPAGFLGVDVFFVVSGFLIARLVTREIAHSGTVSLTRFWGRRARRLLPALATVTVAVLVATAISFSSAELHDLRAQALGTLFYVANWVLIFGKSNYFSTLGRPSPFLHMWTLAVEEQFYVALPLVFLVFRRVIVRRPIATAWVALAGALGSTIWMAILVSPTGDPTRGYLGTDSHAMGLLTGVALGVLAGAGAPWERLAGFVRSGTPAVRAAPYVAVAALVAILVTMRVANFRTIALYRGGFLVFSLVCAFIISVVVLFPAVPIARGLRAPWLVAIGLRSYSLYLWHWPVRVFVTPRPGLEGFTLFAARLLLSVALAEVSYRFIERPLRFGAAARRAGSRPAIAYFCALTLVAGVLVAGVDAPKPLPPTSLADLKPPPGPVKPHTLRVDVFGDSTGLVFGLGGAANATRLGITVGGDSELGCGLVPTARVSEGQILQPPSYCNGWLLRWPAVLRKDPTARIALMAGAWEVFDQQTANGVVRFGTQAWTDLVTSSVEDAIRVLTADGRTVHLFEVPCYGAGDANEELPARHDPNRIAAVNQIFADVARTMPHVEIVHWRDLVCPGGKRAESIDGVHLWLPDDQHLTYAGAAVVWRWWLPQLRAEH